MASCVPAWRGKNGLGEGFGIRILTGLNLFPQERYGFAVGLHLAFWATLARPGNLTPLVAASARGFWFAAV